MIGDDMKTVFAWNALFEAGVYTNAVLPPAVPPNKIAAAHQLHGDAHR